MLELLNVYFSYNGTPVLKDFSLTVNGGECVALKGASGSGKTTAAGLLLGLLLPSSGIITAPKKISAVFQEDRFVESLSLKQNLHTVLGEEQYKDALTLLEKTGLSGCERKKVGTFSGGMKRRAAIVRAIAFAGDALILDEAFNGIDAENKQICADIIKERFIKRNKPVLLITHADSDAQLLDARTVEIQT